MSRIGKRELVIPDGVTVTIENNLVSVKGSKGELSAPYNKLIQVEVKDNKVIVTRSNETKQAKQLHGTTNAIINNMIKGVTEGFVKELEAVGVGYRFGVSGNKITINAGYSHPVVIEVPSDLKAESKSNTELSISGIRYKGEYIRRKEGKKAA